MILFRNKRKFLEDTIRSEIERVDVQPGYPTWSGIHRDKLAKKAGVMPGVTWCNRAVYRILKKLGYKVDSILSINPYNNRPDIGWTSANSMVRLCKAHPDIWRVPERIAQGLANMGVGILCGAINSPSGHVAVVAPHQWNAIMGAFVGQAGGYNGFYFRKDKCSFGSLEPRFYLLRRNKDGITKESLHIAYKAYIG